MEQMDPSDPNLDGDFRTLIKRLHEIKKNESDQNANKDNAMVFENRLRKVSHAVTDIRGPTDIRTRKYSPMGNGDESEIIQLRQKLFDAAKNKGAGEMRALVTELYNASSTRRQITLGDDYMKDPEDQRTVFHHAIIHRNFEIAKFLLDYANDDFLMEEFDLKLGNLFSQKTALHLLVELDEIDLARIFLAKIEKSASKVSYMEKTVFVQMEGQRARQLSALHLAAAKGNTGIIELLINAGMNINYHTAKTKNDTPIIWAARWNHMKATSRLLELGADANLENDKFSTPLYWAVRYGYPEMVKLLITQGKANVHFRRKLGFEVSIILAAALGYGDILHTLVEHGAKINDKTAAGLTALHVAATYGNNGMINILLDCDPMPDLEMGDNLGNTPLMLAVKEGHLSCVENLLSSGANIQTSNNFSETIWDAAITSKNPKMLDLVVDMYKASRRMGSNLVFPEGKTPLHVAALQGNVEYIDMLLERGADVHAKDYGGNTFFHIAARENRLEVLQQFMSRVDINKQNNEGNTPIHLASQQGHLDTINLLINKAKLDIKNNQNETVLHAGAKSHSEEAAEVVRKLATTVVNTQSWSLMDAKNDNGNTALHIAARNTNFGIIKSLSPLNPKILNNDGANPLHVAASNENKEILKEMLEVFHIPSKGLDINHTKGDGETLLHICAKKGDVELVEILIARGADLTITDHTGNTVLHDLTYQSVIDPANCAKHLQVFQTVVDNCTQWWCNKQDLYYPDRGSQMFIDYQRQALIYLLEDINNKLNLSVKTYASYLGATAILQEVFNIPDVFCFKERDAYIYDVTNVAPETMVVKPNGRSSKRLSRVVSPSSVGVVTDEKAIRELNAGQASVVLKDSLSCLDIIVKMDNIVLATKVLDVVPIRYIIEDYWSVYRFIYGLLMLFHITYMLLLSIFAIPLSQEIWANQTDVNAAIPDPNPIYTLFLVTPIVLLVFSSYYIVVSIMAFCKGGKHTSKMRRDDTARWCSGGIFRFIYNIFASIFNSLALIGAILLGGLITAWYILYMTSNKAQVYVLSGTLLIGWVYTITYCKGFQTVHSFVIMLQQIIVRDITRFAFIYIFILLAFAYSMHALFQITPFLTVTYSNFGYTLFDTFNLMIGMGDAVASSDTDMYYEDAGSSGVYLRVVYVIYMIASAVILLNLLIAMMSDSYNAIRMTEGTTWRVGSVKMAINIEHSIKFISRIFNFLRKTQSSLPITFNDETFRYTIRIPLTTIEESFIKEESDSTRSLKLLESKLNFMNDQFADMNYKLNDLMERYEHLEGDMGTVTTDQASSIRRPVTARHSVHKRSSILKH